MKKKFVVYLVTNIVNGKYYVGKDANYPSRFKDHLRAAKNGSKQYLHKAMRKYGDNYFIEDILSIALNKEDLLLLERAWILILNSYSSAVGYNQSFGGDGGFELITEEARRRGIEVRIGKSNSLKNKTYEEIYGLEKATKLRIFAKLRRKGKTSSEIFGSEERSASIRVKQSEGIKAAYASGKMKSRKGLISPLKGKTAGKPVWNKGKTYSETLGEEKAKEISLNLAKAARFTHTGRKRSLETRMKQSLAAKLREDRKKAVKLQNLADSTILNQGVS